MSADPEPREAGIEKGIEGRSDAVRFEVDTMLIKLARYLRCLGYDATWDLDISLARRIDRANRESRIFLTRSRRIEHQERAPGRLVIVRSSDPVEQVREVQTAASIDDVTGLFSRCIRCNVVLRSLVKDERLRARVHDATFASFAHFFECPSCATVFWKGSHVRNTCRKLRLADASERSVTGPGDTPDQAERGR